MTTGGAVSAVILAAGRSERLGGTYNKLLAEFGGVPLLRHVAEQVCQAPVSETVVVIGHQADRVRHAVRDLPVRFVDNGEASAGMSTSLKAGISALSADSAGGLIVLADMPGVVAADYQAMLAAFTESGCSAIIRATHAGKRGNPVLLPRSCFAAIAVLRGDVGARGIVESGAFDVVDVEIGRAASLDVDTAEALRAAGGVLVR